MSPRVAFLGVLALACGAADATRAPSDGGGGGQSGGGAGQSGGGAGQSNEVPDPSGRLRCRAPAGVSASPQTIEEAVALANALPKPTSVACFVESLERPLIVSSTSSPFSAQPALSAKSPRMFLQFGQLWLSIVIDGAGSELIEFGYLMPDTLRSIKGELRFPLQEPVAPSAPYDKIFDPRGGGTVCRLCHGDERPEVVRGIANAYSSVAFRPRPDTAVSTEALRLDVSTCDWQKQPNRCQMLSAVFGGGPVVDGSFPATMPTFF